MNQFWNEKYKGEDYLYGTEPNQFIKSQLDKLQPGKILFPAEGEGRNAVWAAYEGWNVSAFDPSSVAQKKALNLAKKNNVEINYQLLGYDQVNYPINHFDAIVLSYAHMPPDLRKRMHAKFMTWLKPGGYIIMEAFSKEQLAYSSGGPKDISMLYSTNDLLQDFNETHIKMNSIETINLLEGKGHNGKASVIHFVATV